MLEAHERKRVSTMTDQQPPTMAKDPVCGMDVDPTTAKQTSQYEGQTYYFCSPGCKQSFDGDPRRYLQGRQ